MLCRGVGAAVVAALAAGAAGAGAGDPSDILSPLEQGTKNLPNSITL